MLAILRAIAAKVGADTYEDPDLEALSEDTVPENVAAQIEAHEEKSERNGS